MAEDGRELAATVGPLGLWTGQFEGQPFESGAIEYRRFG